MSARSLPAANQWAFHFARSPAGRLHIVIVLAHEEPSPLCGTELVKRWALVEEVSPDVTKGPSVPGKLCDGCSKVRAQLRLKSKKTGGT